MEQKLFTELRPLYVTSRESPNEIRIRIRMRDLIDPIILRHAVDTTMERYPYFLVELRKKDKHYVFMENHRPVVITNSLHGVALNSADSNFHMIAFCWQDNWIILDVFHGMTDGTGAYEVLRTLLFYDGFRPDRGRECADGRGLHQGHQRLLLSKESDRERLGAAGYINALAARVVTATVSYVGKANYKEAEQYIRDFRLWTSSAADGLTVEIFAVNGRFTLDFLQTFPSPLFVNAFLKELEENGIVYDPQDVNELELPNIELPWTEQ